ncbi:hypothetical protein DMP17_22130 [Pseudonocardia sp. TMWB2A]
MAGLPPDPWQADAHDLMGAFRPDGNWCARNYAEWVPRQNGKSGGIGVPRALAGLLLFPERLLLWSAHEYKTSTEAFELVKEALLMLGDEVKTDLIVIPPLDIPGAPLKQDLYVKVSTTNGKEGFRTWTEDRSREWRKRLRFVARSKSSGRGFAGDLNVIDEAFAYTRAQQSALAPTGLAKPFSQTVYLSTPPLNGAEGEVMYRLRERAIVERDPRLGYRDWGLAMTLDELGKLPRAERRDFVRDPANWASVMPARGYGRVTDEAIRDLINQFVDDTDAARELLCMWPEQISVQARWQVISEQDWADRGHGHPDDWDDSAEVAFAVAMPPEQDRAAIVVASRSLRTGEIQIQEVGYRDGAAWVEDRIVELTERHPLSIVAIAKQGPAGYLVRQLDQAGIEVVTPNEVENGQAAQRFVELVAKQPVVRHCNQESLDIAVKAALPQQRGDVWRLMRRTGTDISPMEAAALAVWALEDGGGPVSQPLPVPAGSATGMSGVGDLSDVGF